MHSLKNEQLVLQLSKPRHTRALAPKALLIAVSLITITLCLLFTHSPLAKWISHLSMAPYTAWTTLLTGVLTATSSARVTDLSGFQWTLSNPGLDVSVPGKVPSVV
jgi:hypothetical protein